MAQLPIVFLFATKNSIIYVLLGPGVGYEKLNFLHRWSARVMFFAALLHGALWIKVLLGRGRPIFGQEKETTGIVAFSFLALTVLVGLRPVRVFVYQAFFSLQWVPLSFFSTRSSLPFSQSRLFGFILHRCSLPYVIRRAMDLYSISGIWAGYTCANAEVSFQRCRPCSCQGSYDAGMLSVL